MSVAVIDYGMGNLRSVAKALEQVASCEVVVTSDPEQLRRAERVVFPGVGAIRACLNELHKRALIDELRRCAATKPMLGICLGMQALLDFSEENEGTEGLAILPGKVVRFKAIGDLKVPHMGWNQVWPRYPHPLWNGIKPGSRFYFVHSYYPVPAMAELELASSDYGGKFACAVGRGNLFAVQFHPEKSQKIGLALLANFLAWRP